MNAVASEIGVVAKLESGPETLVEKAKAAGFSFIHLSAYDPRLMTEEVGARLRADMAKHDVEITALWAGWPGHVVWDFVEGPVTTGLVPLHLREERAALTKQAAHFAAALGAKTVMTHFGFIPEDLNDERYVSLIPVLRDIAAHCDDLGLGFACETGQETPITLLRTIDDIGMPNVGVNLDPANLLMYGKGNPVDAVDILAPYIRSVHAKDGTYPVNGRELGLEKRLGEGQVDFPALIAKLEAAGFRGGFYVETETYTADRHQMLVDARLTLEAWLR